MSEFKLNPPYQEGTDWHWNGEDSVPEPVVEDRNGSTCGVTTCIELLNKAADRIAELEAVVIRQKAELSMVNREAHRWQFALRQVGQEVDKQVKRCLESNKADTEYLRELDEAALAAKGDSDAN